MTRTASAPLWVRATLVVVLALGAGPAWLFVAGQVFNAIAYRGATAPAVTAMTWPGHVRHHRHLPKVRSALKLSAIAATAPFALLLGLFVVRPRVPLHGDAKWASRRQVRRAGLLDGAPDGIIVGKLGNAFLTASLDRYPHVLLAAPTGSGKGVGTVVPNLLNWDHSAIVLDIKLENWRLTAGFRQAHGQAVYLFNPLQPERRTHRWNPLAYINADPNLRIDDIQAIGQILFPDIDGTDPIWTASCRSLFLGIVLYLLETPPKPVTLGQVAREACAGDDTRWRKLIADRQAEDAPLPPACVNALLDYVNTSDNTRTSIRKTFTSRFDLFANPLIDAATAGNDFDLAAVRKRRMTVYLGITPNALDRLAPLLNLFFQQVIDLNTRELPEHNPALRYQCLLLPDEFRALGRMKVLVNAVAFLRGYGLRLLPVFQAPAQVREVYGDEAARSFFKNHALRIAYTPADIDDATEISRELGNFTYKATSTSKPQGLSGGRRSQSESDQARALLLPQEVKALADDEVVIFAKGVPPIRARKICWYTDPAFRDRAMPAPQIPIAPLPTVLHAAASSTGGSGDDATPALERESATQHGSETTTTTPAPALTEVEREMLTERLYDALLR